MSNNLEVKGSRFLSCPSNPLELHTSKCLQNAKLRTKILFTTSKIHTKVMMSLSVVFLTAHRLSSWTTKCWKILSLLKNLKFCINMMDLMKQYLICSEEASSWLKVRNGREEKKYYLKFSILISLSTKWLTWLLFLTELLIK